MSPGQKSTTKDEREERKREKTRKNGNVTGQAVAPRSDSDRHRPHKPGLWGRRRVLFKVTQPLSDGSEMLEI